MKQWERGGISPMANIFKSIDNFLTDCEEYVDTRVWNGKFINDIKNISETSVEHAKDSYHKNTKKVRSSPTYIAVLLVIKKIWNRSMQITLFAEILLLLGDATKLYTRYFAHYLLLLIVSLFTAYWLLGAFQTNPLFFSLVLLPLLFLNHVLQIAFYLFIEERNGVKLQLNETVTILQQTLKKNVYLFLLQVSAATIIIILHFGISFIISTVFGAFSIDWSNSYIYWILFTLLLLFLIGCLCIVAMTLLLAYPFIIIDKLTVFEAINRSRVYTLTDFRHSGLYYLLLAVVSLLITAIATGKYYEGGLTVSILFSGQASLLLSFLLRKRYFAKAIPTQTSDLLPIRSILKPTIVFGILSYIAFSALLVQIHGDIMRFFLEQRPKITTEYQYKTFNNFEAGYSINYPLTWFVTRSGITTATIYSGDRETDFGGIKITIDIYSATNSTYFTLYDALPGEINLEPGTKNVTTKIINFIRQGKDGVKYTYAKLDAPPYEYQTHYLILDDDVVYDIAFRTASQKIASDYEVVFDTMMESFTFLTE